MKPILRVLLLLRYGEESDGWLASTQDIMAGMWPTYDVKVEASDAAFKEARGKFGNGFQGWVRYAGSDVTSAGPTWHAFAVVDDVVGATTGEIIQLGAAHNRSTYRIDVAAGSWRQVVSVTPVASTKKKHDWKVTCG